MYSTSSNEKDWINLLIEGDELAFEKLYRLYSERLLAYLIRLLKSEDMACEVLHEVFIKLWNNRQQKFRHSIPLELICQWRPQGWLQPIRHHLKHNRL